MRRLFLLLFILGAFSSLTRAQTCSLNATSSNFASQLAALNPGQTLCLASGNYGTFNGAAKSSPGVTITAASGATPTMSIGFCNDSAVSWLILNGLTITGGIICAPTTNVTFQNNTWTDKLQIWASGANNACSQCPAMNNANVLFNGELFNMAANPSGAGGYEGRVQFNYGGPTPAGITIENSRFTTGCADGIQLGGAGVGYGVDIGPNNEFYNLMQGSCGPHVDSIQFNGDENGPNSIVGPNIFGNYFHNNTTGVVSYDYDTNAHVYNNVMTNIAQDSILAAGFDSTSVIEYNTVIGDIIICGQTHEGNNCLATFRDNIADGFTAGGGPNAGFAPIYFDYNLCTNGTCAFGSHGAGVHSLSGNPTFVGGSSPSTYVGFALTSTSLGHAAGTGGSDIGANVSGGSTSNRPSAPTLTVSVQ
jgi:hypothetical protein